MSRQPIKILWEVGSGSISVTSRCTHRQRKQQMDGVLGHHAFNNKGKQAHVKKVEDQG